MSESSGIGGGAATQQLKEAMFLQEVRQAAAEERANKLRWYDYNVLYNYNRPQLDVTYLNFN